MNFRNIGVIISREYATRVRKKSFLAITFIVPVLFALLCTLPTLIILMSKEKDKTVEVVDRSGIVMPYLTDNDALSFIDCSASDLDSLKKGISSDGADAILYISPVDTAARTVSVDMFSLKPVSVDVKESIVVMVETAVEDYRLAAYEIDGLRQIMDDVKKMMNLLPPTQREVVFMRFYQDLSFKEIAELTGVSINTSLGRMRYAILNLRRMTREHNIVLQLD